MKLTKKKAIQIAIELWEYMAESGSASKASWEGWNKYGEMQDDCPFCEYSSRQGDDGCGSCPLNKFYPSCYCSPSFSSWCVAGNKKERKVYAKKFLGELKELK